MPHGGARWTTGSMPFGARCRGARGLLPDQPDERHARSMATPATPRHGQLDGYGQAEDHRLLDLPVEEEYPASAWDAESAVEDSQVDPRSGQTFTQLPDSHLLPSGADSPLPADDFDGSLSWRAQHEGAGRSPRLLRRGSTGRWVPPGGNLACAQARALGSGRSDRSDKFGTAEAPAPAEAAAPSPSTRREHRPRGDDQVGGHSCRRNGEGSALEPVTFGSREQGRCRLTRRWRSVLALDHEERAPDGPGQLRLLPCELEPRGGSSAGTSMPSESLNPTARFVGSSIVYSTLIDRPLS